MTIKLAFTKPEIMSYFYKDVGGSNRSTYILQIKNLLVCNSGDCQTGDSDFSHFLVEEQGETCR
jgi:hypothetical protein